jgi:hypothetical protein
MSKKKVVFNAYDLLNSPEMSAYLDQHEAEQAEKKKQYQAEMTSNPRLIERAAGLDKYTPEQLRQIGEDAAAERAPLGEKVARVGRNLYGKGGFVKRVSPYKATGLPARSHVRRIEMLRRGLPAIRTLAQHLQRTDPGPFEGVALVEIATGNVPEGFGGLAIYESEEKAREILGYWERNPENRGKYEPRRARVSMAAGLEILPA